MTMLGGRYRLSQRIAAGGMGEVWRAEDTVLGRQVAVKVLKSEYADSPEFLTRFRREARLAASLSHAGVAQVYDSGDGQGGQPPYLVMEFVDGESLGAVLARVGRLNEKQTANIVAQAASALAAAHRAGLVHRDVKPANILIGRDGSVKLTDFGIARAVDAAPLTQADTVVGTPLYISPEQAAGQPATPASDLYSLGIVAYECLTGEPPFQGDPVAVTLAHRDQPLPRTLPGLMGDLINALTAKDPKARPTAATGVAAWAQQVAAGVPGVAGTGAIQAVTDDPRDRAKAEQEARSAASPRDGESSERDTSPSEATRVGAPVPIPVDRTDRADRTAAGDGDGERSGPRRRAVLIGGGAIALAAVAGGLGWALRGEPAESSTPPPRRSQPSDNDATTPLRTVLVDGRRYRGRRVAAVVAELTRLGLRPVVQEERSGRRNGTVLRVVPDGRVPIGSAVTVVAARERRKGRGRGRGRGGRGRDGGGSGGGNSGPGGGG